MNDLSVECLQDPGHVRQISDDCRVDEPNRALLGIDTDDPVASCFAWCAGTSGLLLVVVSVDAPVFDG